MKKYVCLILAAVMCITLLGACGGSSKSKDESQETFTIQEPSGLIDLQDVFYDIPEGTTVAELIDIAEKNAKIMKAYKPFLDESTVDAVTTAKGQLLSSKDVASAENYMDAWSKLTQTEAIADRVWFLWDEDNMPVLDGETVWTEADFAGANAQDNIDYRPFVIKYLLDDPSTAKGNILINSGGERSNDNEGYPVAERFNELGYNCFIVNRRSLPYKYEDKAMDLQRAIKMVRYYGAQEGWGGMNMIAAYGGSAGGIVIEGVVNCLYGTNTPNVFCASYVPDEIDALSADLDVSITCYFGGTEIETDEGVPDYAKPEFLYNEENPNWPAAYICAGTEDSYGADETAEKLYNQLNGKVPCVLNIIEGALHGFGVDGEDQGNPAECALWPDEADAFMQENLGHSGVN